MACCASLSLLSQEFEPHTFTAKSGIVLPYRLLVPPSSPDAQKPDTRFPLLLFLHGAGERGTNNTAQLVHGTKLYLDAANRAKFPCYVIAPQCPEGKQWANMPWSTPKGTQPAEPSEPMKAVLELLDASMATMKIDPQRIYVTGLSMGGYGTWDLITRFPDRFAAAAPICGGGDETVAPRAVKSPIWAFHSDDDSVVPVSRTRNMVAALRAAGGTPKYFEYWGLGHNSWGKAYSEPEFLPWMFAQTLGNPDTFTLHSKPEELPAVARIPDTDDGMPGVGPVRRYDWFRNLWRQRRIEWLRNVAQDQGALVFLGDSITQGWGDLLGKLFPGTKTANRGISGDTTRGVLYRLPEDVLALHPKGVVLLIGTNDLEENATPETAATNVVLILDALRASNPKMPVVLCKVMPSSETMKRPREKIVRLNELVDAAIKDRTQVTVCDTWTLFADASGNAKKEEFPDLLHPNEIGYRKWTELLHPILGRLGLEPVAR